MRRPRQFLIFALAASWCAAADPTEPALTPAAINAAPDARYARTTRAFQGIPGIARTRGGRLWATWYGGGTDEGPENYVMLATSADDGRTWSDVCTVIDPPGPVRAYDPTLWTDPEGRLWWFYAQSYGWWDGRAGVWATTADDPDSASPHWTTPRRLADGIMMNKPTVTHDGAWLFPISVWTQKPAGNLAPDDRRYVPAAQMRWDEAKIGAHVYRSRDRGGTLLRIGTVQVLDPQFDEHMLVERRDHSLWLLARDKAGIAESTSTDGGTTWAKAKQSEIPHVASRFFIRRLRSGSLLLVKHNPQLDTQWRQQRKTSNPLQQRSHLTAYASRDEGKTWQGGLLLDARLGVAYPDGDEAPDGRIFLIYDFNRKTDKQILLATFTEAEVAAGQITDRRSALRLVVHQPRSDGR